ncbi:chorismate mutase [Aestuariivirga sp.]|uniref:chorismate mutase n=1 Tax=Aestuariivirga sp. TaxID=2650926 RepID=UPI0039E586A3
MQTAGPDAMALEDIRREIDAIDDAMLDLLAARARASLKVKQVKTGANTLSASPIRPMREAAILKRLLARRDPNVSSDLLVRLWRLILASSTLAQANLTLHVPRDLTLAQRLLLRDHFGPTPVSETADPLAALCLRPGDVAAVSVHGEWAKSVASSAAGAARIIAMLPVQASGAPELLVFGHTETLATGDDITVVLSKSPVPRAIWQLKSGGWHAAALPGFLQSADLQGLIIAGRCPAPLKVLS